MTTDKNKDINEMENELKTLSGKNLPWLILILIGCFATIFGMPSLASDGEAWPLVVAVITFGLFFFKRADIQKMNDLRAQINLKKSQPPK